MACETDDISNDDTRSQEEMKATFVFDDLPIEIRVKIFSHLDQDTLKNINHVSKQWKKLSEDPILWKHLVLPDTFIGEKLEKLLRRTSLLVTLTIQASHHFPIIANCSQNFIYLRNLNVGFSTPCPKPSLSLLIKNCRLIEILNLEGCEEVDDTCIAEIVTLENLHSLIITHCRFVTDVGIMLIGNGCSKLTALSIEGITQISDTAIVNLCNQHCDTLKKLKLDGEELSNSLYYLQKCKSLELLSVPFSVGLSDEALQSIQKLENLKSLQINKATILSGNGLATFFSSETLQNLVLLDIEANWMDDQAVDMLTKSCPLLQHLYLCWCWEVTEKGLNMIISRLIYLRHLDLTGLFHITGECLTEIPKKLKYLCSLNLQQCNNIQDALLPKIVEQQPSLRIINYYGELVEMDSDSDS